jgi:hypothetical protein
MDEGIIDETNSPIIMMKEGENIRIKDKNRENLTFQREERVVVAAQVTAKP